MELGLRSEGEERAPGLPRRPSAPREEARGGQASDDGGLEGLGGGLEVTGAGPSQPTRGGPESRLGRQKDSGL